jgi:hypothetical protein
MRHRFSPDSRRCPLLHRSRPSSPQPAIPFLFPSSRPPTATLQPIIPPSQPHAPNRNRHPELPTRHPKPPTCHPEPQVRDLVLHPPRPSIAQNEIPRFPRNDKLGQLRSPPPVIQNRKSPFRILPPVIPNQLSPRTANLSSQTANRPPEPCHPSSQTANLSSQSPDASSRPPICHPEPQVRDLVRHPTTAFHRPEGDSSVRFAEPPTPPAPLRLRGRCASATRCK